MLTGEPFLDLDEAGVGYMELQAVETKVSNKKDRRRKALPIICLSHGISGCSWAVHWLAVRAKLGLDAHGMPLMPAISRSGVFGKARLKTHEAVVWLRELLKKVGTPAADNQLIGTHSAKCTVLSWAAKAGLALAVRKQLGYHTSSREETALIYSRDASAGPMMELKRLYTLIESGSFEPDVTRSGRWRETRPEAQGDARGKQLGSDEPGYELVEKVVLSDQGDKGCLCSHVRLEVCEECHTTGCSTCLQFGTHINQRMCGVCLELNSEAVQTLCESSASDDSDSSSNQENDRDALVVADLIAPKTNQAAEPVAQHRISRTIHLLKSGLKVLRCGRLVDGKYEMLQAAPSFRWPKCQSCYKTVHAESSA